MAKVNTIRAKQDLMEKKHHSNPSLKKITKTSNSAQAKKKNTGASGTSRIAAAKKNASRAITSARQAATSGTKTTLPYKPGTATASKIGTYKPGSRKKELY